MAFSLSFSPEFYHSEDLDNADQPYSVEMALRTMTHRQWAAMARAVFPTIYPENLTMDQVMDMIRETDTCSNLDSPVHVWIDPEGYHTVSVHEAPRHVPDLDSKTGGSLCGAETGEVVAWLDRDFVANCQACKAKLESETDQA